MYDGCKKQYKDYICSRHAVLRQERKCTRCSLPLGDEPRSKCEGCWLYLREQAKKISSKRKQDGLCLGCGSETNGFLYCYSCLIVKKERSRQCRERLRVRVITKYGGKCTCCGEDNLVFLAIDHIKGDGNQHRKKLFGDKHTSYLFYRWLEKNNFPSGFQVLCHNCNFAKWRCGVCPHQKT